MSSQNPEASIQTFQFSNLDWSAYIANRPIYPPTLYELVFAYHKGTSKSFSSRSHSSNPNYDSSTSLPSRFNTALDVGAGAGVITSQLLPRFTHVTLSDPHEPYLAQARSIYANTDPSHLSFLQAKLEDMTPTMLSKGKVDMITAATCLHWMDCERAIRAAAGLLKPGGTFAAWTYGSTIRLYQIDAGARGMRVGERIQTAQDRLLDRVFDLYEEQIGGLQGEESFVSKGNSRYDCVGFDEGIWEDVVRVYDHTDMPFVSGRFPETESCVRDGQMRVVLAGNEKGVGDLGREVDELYEVKVHRGLVSREGGFEEVRDHYAELVPTLELVKNAPREIEELRVAMEEEGVKRVRLESGLAMVLARRK